MTKPTIPAEPVKGGSGSGSAATQFKPGNPGKQAGTRKSRSPIAFNSAMRSRSAASLSARRSVAAGATSASGAPTAFSQPWSSCS